MAYVGTSERNSPIIVLPEELQAVNRTGQLGDAGRMNAYGGFTLHDMLLNPQEQWKDLTQIQCQNTRGYCSQLSMAAFCCSLAPDIAILFPLAWSKPSSYYPKV